jgi:hypothetical protein
MTGFWQVSPAAVADIDRALFAFLRQQKISSATTLALEKYGRQYLGFFRGTHPHVYVNAFPRDFGVTAQNAESQVIVVCDDNWKVEYDVETRRFAQFGIDSGPPPFGGSAP